MLLFIDDEDDHQGNQTKPATTDQERDTNQAGVPLSVIWSLGALPVRSCQSEQTSPGDILPGLKAEASTLAGFVFLLLRNCRRQLALL